MPQRHAEQPGRNVKGLRTMFEANKGEPLFPPYGATGATYAYGNSVSVTKTLESLGFSAEQKSLLSKGQQVIVESSKNNNHIAAIYKIEGDRLLRSALIAGVHFTHNDVKQNYCWRA